MNDFALLLIWCWPLLLAAPACLRHASWTLVLAPLPALLVALDLPVGAGLSLPWLLLGTELGLDDTGRLFLLFSSLLWLAAGLYGFRGEMSGRHGARHRVFFLLAMAGNLGLIVAQDVVSFYLGFTLMGLAAYGLLAHPANRRARYAARRYLVWTIAGELLLFSAIVMLAVHHGAAPAFAALQSAPPSGFVVLLLILGFGIKLALPGLHFWLPQAYATAPAPAAAVLSGAMIKAGLLGWLRFLPPGQGELAGWGQLLIVTGLAGILFGVLLGLQQRSPRLLLGYSSISKMGVLTLGMGAALVWPGAAPALVGALAIYAAHHALVKGALFLGIGLVERSGPRPWLLAGLAFLATALAGAPLTSGALAKSGLTASLPAQAGYLVPLLALSAFATTLLMARFLFLCWRQPDTRTTPCRVEAGLAWLLLLGLIAIVPVLIADSGQLQANLVPVTLAVVVAAAFVVACRRRRAPCAWPRVLPEPGLAIRIRRATRRSIAALTNAMEEPLATARRARDHLRTALSQRMTTGFRVESEARSWQRAGVIWLLIGSSLLAALIIPA